MGQLLVLAARQIGLLLVPAVSLPVFLVAMVGGDCNDIHVPVVNIYGGFALRCENYSNAL